MSQLKRQHSADPFTGSVDTDTPASGATPATDRSTTPPKATEPSELAPSATDPADGFLGSPLKKQRASVSTADENALRRRIAESSGRIKEVLGTETTEDKTASIGSFGNNVGTPAPTSTIAQNEEEEL